MRKGWLMLILGLLGALLATMAVVGLRWSQSKTTTNQRIYNSRMTPTILIPGSSASQNRFDQLIAQLNKGNNKHSLVKVTVKTDNSMVTTGKVRNGDSAPYFVVAFENNHDGYANIKKQASWFNEALQMLQRKCRFRQFQAIGHSNGGLIWTRFLEKYYDSDSQHVNVLMTIGTPYNFEETNPNNRTQMLQDFIKNRDNLPSDLTVYSIMGTETYDDDGIVPEQSVQTGKFIFQKQVAHFTEITVTGDDAQHSDLPQNQQIVDLIQQYVLPNNQDVPGNRK